MKQNYLTPAFKSITIGTRSSVCNDFSGGLERLSSGAYGGSDNGMDD